MIRCPECDSPDIRVHGTLANLTFEPRWRWFGPRVPRIRVVKLECSCGKCLYAFIASKDGIKPAPRQDAYNQLRAARDAVTVASDGRKKDEREKAVPLPRPAPDPRARKRR